MGWAAPDPSHYCRLTCFSDGAWLHWSYIYTYLSQNTIQL